MVNGNIVVGNTSICRVWMVMITPGSVTLVGCRSISVGIFCITCIRNSRVTVVLNRLIGWSSRVVGNGSTVGWRYLLCSVCSLVIRGTVILMNGTVVNVTRGWWSTIRVICRFITVTFVSILTLVVSVVFSVRISVTTRWVRMENWIIFLSVVVVTTTIRCFLRVVRSFWFIFSKFF